MGDEMSKRKKFMFVTWVGPNVSVINRAKMSTDKAIIKDIISVSRYEIRSISFPDLSALGTSVQKPRT